MKINESKTDPFKDTRSTGRISCFIAGLTLAPLATGTLSNCSSRPSANFMHRDSIFVKSSTEVAALEQKVANGDSEAACDLFGQYALGLRNEAKAEPWLQEARKLGNPKAKRYIKNSDAKDAR